MTSAKGFRIFSTDSGVAIDAGGDWFLDRGANWLAFINHDQLYTRIAERLSACERIQHPDDIRPPAMDHEVWAAGVTYKRSREARIEEARHHGGGGDFYAMVYEAVRPELFLKATPGRCVGTGDQVHIRRDAAWNVPEPELVLFVTSSGRISGYSIGNDMSSRDIEGQNPLYLPQAKCYDRSASVGPGLFVPAEPISPATQIEMEIFRAGSVIFQGAISIDQMKRTHQELVDFLFLEMSFPRGVFLMTGTCLVPPDSFTLAVGDEVRIRIDPIGALVNTIATRTL